MLCLEQRWDWELGLGVRVKRGERVRIQHKGDRKWKESRKQMDMADRALRAVQELVESLHVRLKR